jgi:large subunit ribosomal protein L21
MYAVIETGGKQYRVAQGEQVEVEKLDGAVGTRVEFDRVLMVRTDQGVVVGHPVVEKAKVVGEVLAQGRGGRIIVFKKKRRKNYRRTRGHRQSFTRIKIVEIQNQ